MEIRELPHYERDQRFPRLAQFIKGHRMHSHSDEASIKLCGQRFPAGGKDLSHGTVVAEQIDDEGRPKFITNTFVREEITNIKEIAWVLPVQGGDELPGVEVGERDNAHFCEAKRGLDDPRDGTLFRLKDAASQNGRHLDFHLSITLPNQHLCRRLLRHHRGETERRTSQPFFDTFGNTPEGGIDSGERLSSARNRQPGEVDIDRQTRHVANKQVDRRSALQSKAVFHGYQGKELEQQPNLPLIDFTEGRRDPWVR